MLSKETCNIILLPSYLKEDIEKEIGKNKHNNETLDNEQK
jgi:hypothetical protein